MPDDPYSVLGVPPTATAQQLVEAYRALVQIYHPDRYAEAPDRVRAEAVRRMQAVNGAYDKLRQHAGGSSAPATPEPSPPRARRPTAQRPRPTQMVSVLYVDGSRHFHDPAVAPLGLDLRAEPPRFLPGARQCDMLDGELGRWFQAQSRNASMTDKLMYAAWDEQQRALYTATVGCSEVLLSSVEPFASPCLRCGPGSSPG